MPHPAWMKGYPGAPTPLPVWISQHIDTRDTDDEPVGIKPCTCRGEGCTSCDGDGVVYP